MAYVHAIQFIQDLDRATVLHLNRWITSSPVWLSAAITINQLADFILSITIVGLWFSRDKQFLRAAPVREHLLLFTLCLAPAYVIARVLQRTFLRPRPLVSLTLHMTMPQGDWKDEQATFTKWGSLPSDHAVMLGIFVILLFVLSRRAGWAGTAFFVCVNMLRMGLGYHWPSDIIAGATVALLVVGVAIIVGRRVRPLFAWFLGQFEAYSFLTYPLAFAWLLDLSHGFKYTQGFVRDVLHARLFH